MNELCDWYSSKSMSTLHSGQRSARSQRSPTSTERPFVSGPPGGAPTADAAPDSRATSFALVRACTDVTKGLGSRQSGLAMVFKLAGAAKRRWRKMDGYELVALVRAGGEFVTGNFVERVEERRDAA